MDDRPAGVPPRVKRADEPCPDDVPDRFGPIARVYDLVEFGFVLLGSDPRVAVSAAIPTSARRILDAGTGTGAVLVRLARTHCDANLTGLDASARMLERAERKLERLRQRGVSCAHTTLVCASAARMPFDDGAFDAVTASLFFHELPPPVRAAAFDEAVRVLAPGGTAVILDLDRRPAGWRAPMQWILDAGEEDYAWQLAGDALARELTGRGLSVTGHDKSMPFMQLVTATRP